MACNCTKRQVVRQVQQKTPRVSNQKQTTGKRIIRDRLNQKSGQTQGGTHKETGKCHRQADLPNNKRGGRSSFRSLENSLNQVLQDDRRGADLNVQND